MVVANNEHFARLDMLAVVWGAREENERELLLYYETQQRWEVCLPGRWLGGHPNLLGHWAVKPPRGCAFHYFWRLQFCYFRPFWRFSGGCNFVIFDPTVGNVSVSTLCWVGSRTLCHLIYSMACHRISAVCHPNSVACHPTLRNPECVGCYQNPVAGFVLVLRHTCSARIEGTFLSRMLRTPRPPNSRCLTPATVTVCGGRTRGWQRAPARPATQLSPQSRVDGPAPRFVPGLVVRPRRTFSTCNGTSSSSRGLPGPHWGLVSASYGWSRCRRS